MCKTNKKLVDQAIALGIVPSSSHVETLLCKCVGLTISRAFIQKKYVVSCKNTGSHENGFRLSFSRNKGRPSNMFLETKSRSSLRASKGGGGGRGGGGGGGRSRPSRSRSRRSSRRSSRRGPPGEVTSSNPSPKPSQDEVREEDRQVEVDVVELGPNQVKTKS